MSFTTAFASTAYAAVFGRSEQASDIAIAGVTGDGQVAWFTPTGVMTSVVAVAGIGDIGTVSEIINTNILLPSILCRGLVGILTIEDAANTMLVSVVGTGLVGLFPFPISGAPALGAAGVAAIEIARRLTDATMIGQAGSLSTDDGALGVSGVGVVGTISGYVSYARGMVMILA
jgi:hypothetical protein